MKLAWFGVEEWLNPMDSLARINLGSSCVSALRMDELFDLTGEDLDAFLNEMRTMSLHYHHGDATGSPRIKAAVAGIYPKGNVKPEEVMITHGGTGANDLVLMSVLEPGDNCVVIKPSYQQHYDIPKGSGIETRVVQLKAEDNYQLDFDALDKACDANTKMIVLTNPNNPIGVTLYDEGLRKVVDIAAKHDAWILCDEVYRGLDENYMPSIKTRRSYNTICCGIWDEIIASIALEHYQALWARARSILEPNRKIVEDWVASQPHLHLRAKAMGTTCLIDYDYDVDSETLAKDAMATEQILVVPGDYFDMPKTIRVGYGAFRDPQVLKAGLEEFGKYLEKYN